MSDLSKEQIIEIWEKSDFGSKEKNLLMSKNLRDITDMDLDYIYVKNCFCCEKCAPYRNRYYNMSGNDSRFPKLPAFFLSAENINHCELEIQPVNKVIISTFIETKRRGDIIAISNRPFIDDRTDQEIISYKYFKYVHRINNAVQKGERENIDFKSGLLESGEYDFSYLTSDESNYVQITLNYINSKYNKEYTAIGLLFETFYSVLKPSYIFNYYVVLKYGESDNPLDVIAVAVAYSKMGAQYREKAIKYFEKFFDNPRSLKRPDSDGLFYEEYYLHKLLAQLYEKEYQFRSAISEWEKMIEIYKPIYDNVFNLCELIAKVDINECVEKYKFFLSSDMEESQKSLLNQAYNKALEKQAKGFTYKPRKSKVKEKDIIIDSQIMELAKQFI